MTPNPQPNPWSTICAREAANPGTLANFAEAVGWALARVEDLYGDGDDPPAMALSNLKGAGKLLNWLTREYEKANPEPPPQA